MVSDRIKSRASFKGEGWTEKRESVGLSGVGVPWRRPPDTNLESSNLESGGVSGASPAASSISAESPAGSRLPSSDLSAYSRSKARAVIEAANPSKIKSPRILAT